MDCRLILSLKKQKSFYGSKIRLLSPAKINLYLNILGKYPDGFHRLQSIVERISLFDELTIQVTKSRVLEISSNFKALEKNSNLCLKAAAALKKKYKIPWGFKISLKKKIPVGSGLGGGSSNAASTISGINHLLNLNLNQKELYQIGADLGSDVNFFLADCKFALLQGRGQKVTPINIDKKYSHYIICPGLEISTRRVYKNNRAKLTKFFNNVKILQYALKQGDVSLVRKNLFNVLEDAAFSFSPELRKAKDYLLRREIVAKLTGSGGAFYTISKKASSVKIKDKLPRKWFVCEAKTF
jgi:4-diphosphocytidyl-2-C-methyl-D-erythritol kinase